MPLTRRSGGRSSEKTKVPPKTGQSRASISSPKPSPTKLSGTGKNLTEDGSTGRTRTGGGATGKTTRSGRSSSSVDVKEEKESEVLTEFVVKKDKVLYWYKEPSDESVEGDSVRRSGRKRVLSSRLQDMEVTLGSPKVKVTLSSPKVNKRSLTDSPEKSVKSSKKAKLSVPPPTIKLEEDDTEEKESTAKPTTKSSTAKGGSTRTTLKAGFPETTQRAETTVKAGSTGTTLKAGSTETTKRAGTTVKAGSTGTTLKAGSTKTTQKAGSTETAPKAETKGTGHSSDTLLETTPIAREGRVDTSHAILVKPTSHTVIDDTTHEGDNTTNEPEPTDTTYNEDQVTSQKSPDAGDDDVRHPAKHQEDLDINSDTDTDEEMASDTHIIPVSLEQPVVTAGNQTNTESIHKPSKISEISAPAKRTYGGPVNKTRNVVTIKPEQKKPSSSLLANYLKKVVPNPNLRKVQVKTEEVLPPGGDVTALTGEATSSNLVILKRPGSLIRGRSVTSPNLKVENSSSTKVSTIITGVSRPAGVNVSSSRVSSVQVVNSPQTGVYVINKQQPRIKINASQLQSKQPLSGKVYGTQINCGKVDSTKHSYVKHSESDLSGVDIAKADMKVVDTQGCSTEDTKLVDTQVNLSTDAMKVVDTQDSSDPSSIGSLPEGTQLTVKYMETSESTQPELVCVGFPLDVVTAAKGQSEAPTTDSDPACVSDLQTINSSYTTTANTSDTCTTGATYVNQSTVVPVNSNTALYYPEGSVIVSEQSSITMHAVHTEGSIELESREHSDVSSIQLEEGEVRLSIGDPIRSGVSLEPGEVDTTMEESNTSLEQGEVDTQESSMPLETGESSLEPGEVDTTMESSIELEPGEVSYGTTNHIPNSSVLIVDASGNVMCARSLGDFQQGPGEKLFPASVRNENSASHTPVHIDLTTQTSPMGRGTRAGYVNGDETIEILPDGRIKCKLCPYFTDKKTNWYKHKKKHLGIKNYECEVCTYKCSTSSNLARHMMVHKDIRSFKCDECGLMFRQKIHAIRHKQYKHEKKKLKCDLCDYRCSSYQPEMVAHIQRKHQTEQEFTCPECDYTTLSRKDLQQHRKFHLKGPELKLFCEFCSFVTDCQSRLKRHVITHTKEKPFRCSLCDYQASQKEHVLRHMRTRHREELGLPVMVRKSKKGRHSRQGRDSALESTRDPTRDPTQEPARHSSQSSEDITVYVSGMSGQAQDDQGDTVLEMSTRPHSQKGAGTSQDSTGSSASQTSSLPSADDQGGQEGVVMETPSPQQGQTADDNTLDDDDTTTDHPTHNPSTHLDLMTHKVSRTPSGQSVSMTMVEDKEGKLMPVEIVYSMEDYMNRKKKYPVADFRTKEKFFACNFCSMKFTKLINLYKHVNLQHNYQAPGGDLTCVICDYKTTNKKNLLVHMRKHNPQECGEAAVPDGRLYRCMSCQYTGSQVDVHKHMQQKKMILEDGGEVQLVLACTVLSEDQEALGETTGGVELQGEEPAAQWAGQAPQGVEAVSQWAESVAAGAESVAVGAESVAEGVGQEVVVDNSRTVLLQVDADSPPVPIQVSAAESDRSQCIVGRPQAGLDSQDAIHQLQMMSQQEVESLTSVTTSVEVEDPTRDTSERDVSDPSDSTVQMAAEQLMELSSGDFIEINGETYKVEFSNGEAVVQS